MFILKSTDSKGNSTITKIESVNQFENTIKFFGITPSIVRILDSEEQAQWVMDKILNHIANMEWEKLYGAVCYHEEGCRHQSELYFDLEFYMGQFYE